MSDDENRRTALLAAAYVLPSGTEDEILAVADQFVTWLEDAVEQS